MNKNAKCDFYFNKEDKWKNEFLTMREIALECELEEDLKWGNPCYTLNNKNVVLIHGFKEYCAFLLFKGALLDDPANILIQQTENVQSARQIRFTNISQILEKREILKSYILSAIGVEISGQKVELKKTADYEVPEEFNNYLTENNNIRTAFESLTPGRQRAYLFYFGQAKQSKTRIQRIEKYLSKILEGRGLDD